MIRGLRHPFLILLALAAGEGRADPFESQANQRNMLPGGRAAMLGGAYTAISDDASGSYYNPAGLVFSHDDRLEVSGTAYRSTRLTYEGAINDQPFEERSEVIYPNFFGGTARWGPLTLGYSYMTLDARNVYQQDKYDNIDTEEGTASSYSRTFLERSNLLWVGGTAALRFGEHLSYGGSVFYYQRNIEYVTNQLAIINGGGLQNIAGTLKTLNTGIAGVNGLMLNFQDFTFGLSIRTAMALSNRSRYIADTILFDPDDESVEPTVTHIETKYKPYNELNPTTYTLGMAWHPAKALLVSTDVVCHEGVKSRYKRLGGHDLHTTFNYSLGVELTAGFLSLLGGVFTNNSMFRAPDPELARQPVHVDYKGVSGGISWNIGGLRGELGFVRQVGTGESQIITGSTAIQKTTGEISTYLISGKVPL